jgi:broad specificity polyphosphatase/5'/3'-nucleotidase SurE
MRSGLLLAAAVAPFASAIRIVQSNDDGWAEINARTLFNSLAAAGNDVVLSGPAENQSGTGMSACLSVSTFKTHINRIF